MQKKAIKSHYKQRVNIQGRLILEIKSFIERQRGQQCGQDALNIDQILNW